MDKVHRVKVVHAAIMAAFMLTACGGDETRPSNAGLVAGGGSNGQPNETATGAGSTASPEISNGVPSVNGATEPAEPLSRPVADASTWQLTNTQFTTADPGAITYVGNGYLSAQIGPLGQGYWSSSDTNGWTNYRSRRTSAFAADFPTGDGSYIGDLPLWTGLTLATSSGWLDLNLTSLASRIKNYSQQLDTQHGVVTTTFQVASDLQPITSASNLVSVKIASIADRNDEHHGMVTLEVTPTATTQLSVIADLDISGNATTVVQRAQSATTQTASVTVVNGSASASNMKYAVVQQRVVSPTGLPAATTFQWSTTNGTQITFNAQAGVTYRFVKHVGVGVAATASDAGNVAASAIAAAMTSTPDTILANHFAAWEKIWNSDIVTPGSADLQQRIHSAGYNLYSSLRPNGTESVGPAGLGSLSYDGQIYWDADSWMLPPVLVLNPDLAGTIVNYRVKQLTTAKASAQALSITPKVGTPAYVPWSRREPYAYGNPDWRTALPQPHLMGDIAMGLYDYYATTADTAWLKNGAFDMISGIGDWFRTVSVKNGSGQYTLKGVQGVDETASNVNDHAFTNAGMWRTMQILQQLAPAAGKTINPTWASYQNVAIPTDPNVANVTAEYAGFTTTGTYKPIQIDSLLVQYPAQYPLPPGRALNDYRAYSAITRSNRPGFGDAGFSIIASKLGTCSMSSQFQAATSPFMRGPFLNYWETRDLAQYPDANAYIKFPALPFLTGAGAFLQTMTHGLTGYRFRTDMMEFDPALPSESVLPGTLAIRGLHWQGRIVDVLMTRTGTTIQLVSGSPTQIQTPAGTRPLSVAVPVRIPTRAPALPTTGGGCE
ncbi:glycosyl hydrolase family 65 protein [Burkholderia sp. TSV86]|uniref:glycosyl hydrolase family 65 protein n=1 Tax=Burkholderia sp. TSV86 TaxID=1385594 RepID=UPI000756743B|nr:glycosyl hydrolase family 65 protein [Burkholderia sp. TSV86]KVE34819.1 hypothetical protein WS68_08840 [Burkholderia sp. TSV86]